VRTVFYEFTMGNMYEVLKSKGMFKYHMTLWEGVCSNRQSGVTWGEGGQIVI